VIDADFLENKINIPFQN